MITSTTDAVRASQDQFLSAVRQSQHAMTEAVSAWAAAVEKIAPTAPAVPGLNAPAVFPGLHALPTPESMVDSTFDFAQRLLNAQRDFTRDIVSATAQVRGAARRAA